MKNYAPPKQKMLWPESSKPNYFAIAKDSIFIIVCLLALLSVYSWSMMRDAEDNAESHAKVAAAMLNGHTLHDNNTGDAYFFDKPVIVRFRP
jgi:hypothetical protein